MPISLKGKWSKYKDEILNLYDSHPNPVYAHLAKTIAKNNGEDENNDSIRKYIQLLIKTERLDREIVVENVRLEKREQARKDLNRIANKSFREYARIENALTEYNKQLIKIIKNEGLKIQTYSHENKNDSPSLLAQLADWHFNELVDLPTNKYDFYIASQRLQQFAFDIIKIGLAYGVKNIVVASSGDGINSDRRLDEKLSMSTNRAKATQLAILLHEYFILHLNKYFNVDVAFVTGNESRASQELGWSDILASDNYDFTIFDTLKLLFRGKKGITFHACGANEQVVTVNKKNILLIHGHQISNGNVQKSVQEIVGRYSNMGTIIHFVIFGHIHSAYLSDYFARSGSGVGSNAYSEHALNFVSKASQNVHLIYPYDKIDSFKIDLQNSLAKGYPLEKDIDAYNAKSVSKSRSQEVVFKIVI